MKNIIMNYLKDNNYDLTSSDSDGIKINCINNEIVIKGNKLELIELADYIMSVALSDNDKDHLHIDDLTLLSKDSSSLIIEKE